MSEILILFVLLQSSKTIYSIKKTLDEKLEAFFTISLGTIHPALKKLEKNNYILIEKKISKGGQKSSIYSITEEGQIYFRKLLLQELPDNPSVAEQLIKVKLIVLNTVEKSLRVKITDNIVFYLEKQSLKMAKLLNSPEIDNLNKQYIENYLNLVNSQIFWLNSII